MILGILPSLGGSIDAQERDGRQGLFLNYYAPHYLSAFEEVFYFSYADYGRVKPSPRFHIFPNTFRMHRYLYAFLLPLMHWNEIRKCRLIRVMHLTGAVPAMLIKLFGRIPFIATYGYDYVRFADIEGRAWKVGVLKFVIPIFLRAADGIIVTTPDLKREVERLIGADPKIQIVPNGVDAAHFSPDRRQRSAADQQEFKLIAVGRLEKQKNYSFLLDVISEACRLRKFRLTVIGNGSARQALGERIAKEKLPVELLGSVPYDSVAEYLRRSDGYVSTSLAEGHPKALIEAMSCALPCVVSSSAGNSALIRHGDNGCLMDLTDKQGWVRALVQLADDASLRAHFGEKARQDILESYDLRKTLVSEIAFLKRAAGQSSVDQKTSISS